MRPRYEIGPFKFELGDMVAHEICRIRGKVVNMGWGDDLEIEGTLGNHVKVYLVDNGLETVWLSEALLKKISPLQALAEVAE